jgi:hypothetical protein
VEALYVVLGTFDDAWSASLPKLPRPARGLTDVSESRTSLAQPG